MAGRQLPLFSLIIPAWLVAVMSGWKGVQGLLAGDPGLRRQLRRDPVLHRRTSTARRWSTWSGGVGSLVCTTVFLRFWQPKEIWRFPEETSRTGRLGADRSPLHTAAQVAYAWMPWVHAVGDGLPLGLAGVEDRAQRRHRRSEPNCLAGISKRDVRGAVAAQRRVSHQPRGRKCPRARTAPRSPRTAVTSSTGSRPRARAFSWRRCSRPSGCGSRRRVFFARVRRDAVPRALGAVDHRLHVGPGLHDQVQRGRRHAGPGLHPHRLALSVLRAAAWAGWAWR